MNKIYNFFDKFEDITRGALSRYPIFYAIVGGGATVLLWRAIWHTADLFELQGGFLGWLFYPPNQVIINLFVLLAIGLMVSVFVGDQIIISGLKKEKKFTEKTEMEVGEEVITLKHIRDEVRNLKKTVEEIKENK